MILVISAIWQLWMKKKKLIYKQHKRNILVKTPQIQKNVNQ
jgi:hypothetical protein